MNHDAWLESTTSGDASWKSVLAGTDARTPGRRSEAHVRPGESLYLHGRTLPETAHGAEVDEEPLERDTQLKQADKRCDLHRFFPPYIPPRSY